MSAIKLLRMRKTLKNVSVEHIPLIPVKTSNPIGLPSVARTRVPRRSSFAKGYGGHPSLETLTCSERRMEPAVGIEPTTDGLQNRCSTAELSWRPAQDTTLAAK